MADRPDLPDLYLQMVRMRRFEEALAELWRRGLISGELHLGVGEEAIAAGVVAHLLDGDALALDYRATPPMVGRGVDLVEILLEVLGHDEGLGRGHGGHMHLFDPGRLVASSGIVGSSAPLACGFALSARRLRPGSIAVGFFGDGAVNQGAVLEAWNLAVVWRLPVVFVCKDNKWAVTTRSRALTGGSIPDRARGFGLPAASVDGSDVEAVWRAARAMIRRARRGGGPGLLVASCRRPRGHMEDDALTRAVRDPAELRSALGRALPHGVTAGGGWVDRIRGLTGLGRTLAAAAADQWLPHADPLATAARRLGPAAAGIESAAASEVTAAVETALDRAGVGP
jgi:acetoin:2,6-dichlorophenolindophenol oxidoreductase subunit alpha